jgi:streptogramin lyase
MSGRTLLPWSRAGVFALAALAAHARGQTVTEFPIPTPNSEPLRITVGPDGNLWFGESGANKIGRITPAGVLTEFPTTAPMPDSPGGICTGPDGNIWFMMLHAKVGRMTPAGVATLFPMPSGISQLAGCVAGPDGAIWFTDPGFGKVGRVTTAGVITEFTPPGPTSLPNSITAGPDGALWFTDSGRSRIGRVTTAGAFTFFPTLTAGAFPQDIVVGADGNLWFTETTIQAPYVGRITPAGVVTEFLTPDLSAPSWIAAGPDGNIWYTQPNNSQGKIGKVFSDGSMLEFPTLTANAGPAGIVTGPDGALWFAEFNAGKIGRITTSATFHPLAPCRVADTRDPDGAYGGPALDAVDVYRTFVLAGRCGIPAGATGVSFNFTVTGSTDPGYLRIYPSDKSALPNVSTLSYGAGQTRANNAVLGLGPNRDINVHVDQPPGGFVHFIIDVNGYFQ